MSDFRYPTFEERRALELAAQRARHRELARLARLGRSALRQACKRLASAIITKTAGYETLRGG